MSSPFTITTVEELRAGVGELLERVYVDEWGKRLAPAAGRVRRASSRTLIAVDRGRVVGTARLTRGSVLPLEEQRRLQLEHFAAVVPLERLAVGGRLAVAAPLRSSGLAHDLLQAAIRAAVDDGVRLLFTACQPHLLNLYGQLAFTPYGPVTSREGVGVLVPVVRDLSPGDAGLRDLIASAPGHAARCRLPGELGEALAGSPLDPTVAAALLRSAALVPCGPGDLVVSRGQAVRTLFLVLDGRIDVVDDGQVVDVVARGEFAGVVSYLLGVRQRRDLRAGPEGARLLALPVQAFAGRGDDEAAAEAFLLTLVATLRARCPHAAARLVSPGGVA